MKSRDHTNTQAITQEHLETVAEGVMTIQEACDFIHCSRTKLYELIREGVVPVVEIGSLKRIPVAGLKKALAANLVRETPSRKKTTQDVIDSIRRTAESA